MARTTKNDLLMAGWHNIYTEKDGSLWVHPKIDMLMPFNRAAWALYTRGVDKNGEMK